MKYLLSLALLLVPSFVLSACSLWNTVPASTPSPTPVPKVSPNPDLSGPTTQGDSQGNDSVVAIKTKYGDIVIRLFTKDAPKTTANFLAKAKSGFYNGLTFHRVEPNFVIQGGDPKGNGTGGGTIQSEINAIPFKKGSVGLARGPIKANSNDSQFFICLSTENCQSLTNEYVNFGEVISGFEIATKIQVGDLISQITTATK